MSGMNLHDLGWDEHFANGFKEFANQGYTVGRVAVENRDNFQVLTNIGELNAEVTGKFLYGSDENSQFPKVGDWVALTVIIEEQKALIHEILPRRTFISRKVAGKKFEEQVIATNVDYMFIVIGLDQELNQNKIERYVAMAQAGKCVPVLIVNKCDLIEDQNVIRAQAVNIMKSDPFLLVSAKSGFGIDELTKFLIPGKTFVFAGPSGSGKSSLINRLIGYEIQSTQNVREKDNRGKHTTTRREMILVPAGGILIDTPGIRELYLWDSEENLADTFSDIQQLAVKCFFSDCMHISEKGCAVLAAIESEQITHKHYDNYQKLIREQQYLEEKQTEQRYKNKKQRSKEINKAIREFYKNNPKGKGRS